MGLPEVKAKVTAQEMAADPSKPPILEGEPLKEARASGGAKGGRPPKEIAQQPCPDAPAPAPDNLLSGTKKVVEGLTTEYRVRRMKRDRPDLNARIASGELTLVQAEHIAGIDPRGRCLWMPTDPASAAKLIAERFGGEFALQLGIALSPSASP